MIKWHEASDLVWAYAKKKFITQIKAVAFIVSYLILFQLFVLKMPIQNIAELTLGILMVVIGLAFFMEGLFLGVMPIGEGLGLKLPSRLSTYLILLFSFIIGVGATYAEPAIGVLRAMGGSVQKENAPLLHYILNFKGQELVVSVGAGVGLAVILGVLRFLYNWSLKPLIYPIVLLCLVLSAYGIYNNDFSHILGLAWDCGAVTTGPVTVPLVIALGLGISRVVTGHTDEGTSSGLGVVTLASLLPVIAVLSLGLYYHKTVDLSVVDQKVHAFEIKKDSPEASSVSVLETLKKNSLLAIQAILPLCLFMFLIFRFYLKERFTYSDEVALGIIFAITGLTLFNIGIEKGLGNLGSQVGRILPAAYSTIKLENKTEKIINFDRDKVQIRYTITGEKEPFFFLSSEGKVSAIIFEEKNYNPQARTYEYTPTHGPLWGNYEFDYYGLFIALIFAFFMGYGATLAEPALNALGATVEDISVGTFKKSILIQTVAIGVGVGIALGVMKIIWSIPLFWLLSIPYLVLLVLSHFSTEEFVNIAWDSAGVTTGPITVPLVLAMGLGIGNQSGSIEGFGILAMASVCPIMSVLIMGLIVNRKRKTSISDIQINKFEVPGE
jgi:hypothetical protein